MALEVVDKIRHAEEDAAAIRARGAVRARQIAADAEKQAQEQAKELERAAAEQAMKIKKAASDKGAILLKKSMIDSEKSCRELQQRARKRLNDAVKYAAEVITGDGERTK